MDIQEAYRTLDMYKIQVGQEEMELQGSIKEQWEELQMEGKRIDARLGHPFVHSTSTDVKSLFD